VVALRLVTLVGGYCHSTASLFKSLASSPSPTAAHSTAHRTEPSTEVVYPKLWAAAVYPPRLTLPPSRICASFGHPVTKCLHVLHLLFNLTPPCREAKVPVAVAKLSDEY
jgi:hypothetical protein